mmetsp:Transcript_31392/g.56412  ORF Transcript_31392/g.56412 Transcript_31392/m.56412 type:complete len:748 (-) Transcript_31392:683-2926(-)
MASDSNHDAETKSSDGTLQAAREQKILNLKLKEACLEHEDYVRELHESTWSQAQELKLQDAHSKSHELLHAVEQGTKWISTEPITVQKLMRMCGLKLHPQDMYKPDQKPRDVGINELKEKLQNLLDVSNRSVYLTMSGPIQSAINKVERMQEGATRTQINFDDLSQIPLQCIDISEEILQLRPVPPNLQSHEEEIHQLQDRIKKAKEICDVAVADGEMAIAEEQYYFIAQLLEQSVEVIRDKFRIVAMKEEENKVFQNVPEVLQKSYQSSAPMKNSQQMLKRKCDDDLKALQEALVAADLKDAEDMREFVRVQEKGEKFLKENEDKQHECWHKIQELEKQLIKLADERYDTFKRRIEDTEEEEKRKAEYQEFLAAVAQHRKLLEFSVLNCEFYVSSLNTLDDVVADLGRNLSRHSLTCIYDVSDVKAAIHQEYLEMFRRLYLTIGQLIYKKEKKLEEVDQHIRNEHMQLEFSIETFDPNAKRHSDRKKELYEERSVAEEELQTLKDRLQTIEDLFAPTSEFLRSQGIDFVHPSEEVEESNLARRSKMVGYRTHLQRKQEMKLLAEKEEVKRAKSLIANSPGFRSHIESVGDPYSPNHITHGYGSAPATPAANTSPAAAPKSPSTGNPRRPHSVVLAGPPLGKWKADLMDQTIYYEFLDYSSLIIDFTSAGFSVQSATYDLDLKSSPATIDIHLQASQTASGDLIPAQTQKMLFKRLGTSSFELQMNSDSSVRPVSFAEGTSVVFVRA